jgi:hypothetical protein
VRVRNTLVLIRRKKSNAHDSYTVISDHFPHLLHAYHGVSVGGGLTFLSFCPVEIACHYCSGSIPSPQWYCRHFRSHYPLSTLRRIMWNQSTALMDMAMVLCQTGVPCESKIPLKQKVETGDFNEIA